MDFSTPASGLDANTNSVNHVPDSWERIIQAGSQPCSRQHSNARGSESGPVLMKIEDDEALLSFQRAPVCRFRFLPWRELPNIRKKPAVSRPFLSPHSHYSLRRFERSWALVHRVVGERNPRFCTRIPRCSAE